MIRFTLPLKPIAWARTRVNHSTGAFFKSAEQEKFYRDIARISRPYLPPTPLSGRIRARMVFYLIPPQRKVREHPTVKPDWDNLGKAVSDALNKLMYVDDAQLCDVHVQKFYDWTHRVGRIEVEFEEMEE